VGATGISVRSTLSRASKTGKAQAFEAAINSLSNRYTVINPEVQLSFMDKVAPVYRDYTRYYQALVLTSRRSYSSQRTAQIAELETFCGVGNWI